MKFAIIQFVLLFVCFHRIDSDCPTDEYAQGSTCYQFVNNSLKFDDAVNYCRSFGYNLVSLHSTFDNSYVRMLAENAFGFSDGYFRIGLNTSDEKSWRWTDFSSFDYWNWGNGEPVPSLDCASMFISDGKWRSYPCSVPEIFICAGNSSGSNTTPLPTKGTTTDPCREMFCGMGNCTLSIDGQPYCICNDPCLMANETGTPCTTMINPCSAAAKRACNGGGDYGYCEPDESATTCTFKCNCTSGTPDSNNPKSCLGPYITTPSMNAPFFNRNHDHDELFAPSSSILGNKQKV